MAEADISCWSHHCPDGPGAHYTLPSVPTEEGVACMNDALTSGARAVSSWSVDSFNPWGTANTYVFTVDHEVRSFTSYENGPNPPEDFQEAPSCDGPFRIGPGICAAIDPTTGGFISVDALAWDGCP